MIYFLPVFFGHVSCICYVNFLTNMKRNTYKGKLCISHLSPRKIGKEPLAKGPQTFGLDFSLPPPNFQPPRWKVKHCLDFKELSTGFLASCWENEPRDPLEFYAQRISVSLFVLRYRRSRFHESGFCHFEGVTFFLG